MVLSYYHLPYRWRCHVKRGLLYPCVHIYNVTKPSSSKIAEKHATGRDGVMLVVDVVCPHQIIGSSLMLEMPTLCPSSVADLGSIRTPYQICISVILRLNARLNKLFHKYKGRKISYTPGDGPCGQGCGSAPVRRHIYTIIRPSSNRKRRKASNRWEWRRPHASARLGVRGLWRTAPLENWGDMWRR